MKKGRSKEVIFSLKKRLFLDVAMAVQPFVLSSHSGHQTGFYLILLVRTYILKLNGGMKDILKIMSIYQI